MRQNGFLIWLSSGAFVATVAAGAALLTEGVSNAIPPTSLRQVMATSTPTVTLSPSASSVYQGELVTLTATISPATAGDVQFRDGSTNLGDPVPVNNGTAMAILQTSMLTVSTHLLTAVFTPTTAGSSSTTSTAVPLEVRAPSGATTTRQATILTQSKGSIDAVPPPDVELAATLTQATTGQAVTGRTIKFYGGDQLLCQATTDATGLAQCSGAENLGTQTAKEVVAGYDAVFTGDAEYGPSSQHTSATVGTAPPKP